MVSFLYMCGCVCVRARALARACAPDQVTVEKTDKF